jgi:metal-responsive CopG/Arc/MetJ family transcriptional regulator
MTTRISVDVDEEILKKLDEERKKKNFSRNRLFEYLLKNWFKEKCRIVMED